MNIITIEEQTFKQVCGRFSGFASQVERICKENTRHRNLGKFEPSSYGDDIPKQEKVFPFDAPCI